MEFSDQQEESDEDSIANYNVKEGSVKEVLDEIYKIMSSENFIRKPIIFFLRDLNKFTSTTRQILLYNLLDWTVSSTLPVCVIAADSQMDITETFEKRVKSRFSKRILYTCHLSFESFYFFFENFLLLPGEETWNNHVKKLAEEVSTKQLIKKQYDVDPTLDGLKTLLVNVLCHLSASMTFQLTSKLIN
ncbi:origin recognition complex subunit 4-like [Zophobas morio]|uniref:origin recognition complex subunit 4-like n=1 Tax=Zophobas morio TaxID=2755281 RepID=UPI0030832694